MTARAALRALYGELAQDLAARPGLFCELSGRCCRFREADHRLYLTALEFAVMESDGPPRPPGRGQDRCPWLADGQCTNREGRALACRTYFCSDEAQAADVTEVWHRRVRQIHEEHGVPYHYGDLATFVNRAGPPSSKGA